MVSGKPKERGFPEGRSVGSMGKAVRRSHEVGTETRVLFDNSELT